MRFYDFKIWSRRGDLVAYGSEENGARGWSASWDNLAECKKFAERLAEKYRNYYDGYAFEFFSEEYDEDGENQFATKYHGVYQVVDGELEEI